MKYIYKLSIIIFSLVLVTSCALDDDPALSAIATNKLEAATAITFERIPASQTEYTVVVNLVPAASQFTRLYYTLDGEDLSVDINEGTQRVEIPVDMSVEDVRVVRLSSLSAINSSQENINPVISEEKGQTVIVKGDETIIRMTWSDGTDIDLLLTAGGAPAAPYELSAATAIDASLNIGPLEEVRLPGNAADGNYTASIIPFEGFNSSITFNLEVYADDAYNLTGSLDSGLPASGGFFAPLIYETVVDFATIAKSGSSFTVTNNL